jgi:hypothetical protein
VKIDLLLPSRVDVHVAHVSQYLRKMKALWTVLAFASWIIGIRVEKIRVVYEEDSIHDLVVEDAPAAIAVPAKLEEENV